VNLFSSPLVQAIRMQRRAFLHSLAALPFAATALTARPRSGYA